MIPRITVGALAASALIALCSSLPTGPAAACNRMDGCVHDAQLENYGMMHDGRMSEAMRSGAANVEAFRSTSTMASQQEQPRPKPRRRSDAASGR
ncbi:MAG: hypothetical protein GY873_28120 [Bosea sp.]|uniref:hypothetical protein n=1 Tax=Bosea sp. (in: a-proteobacteria) TaxID=1871050 RepID=UPI00239DD5F5|nr:hypothetical protein [Bosea sp. (in: a-proteobacteria)]MCP4738064.1 hypothetical protein [Bosea sp. (in: a-proteobacteria)]